MKHLSALAFLTLAACANAGGLGTSDFATVGNIRVNQVSADVFEVMSRPGGNPMAQYWCGAGNYAGQVLGAPAGARIYVVGEAGRAVTSDSLDAAQFSLKPAGQASGATGRKGTYGPRIGEDEFVADARRYCLIIGDPFAIF
ncbi:hypothetical protein [Shimia sp.]|jgi:hypothetical protein|uniref:hypothetical protein n=1 Tax=unclassified Shimia TaxID=2630038 RepID=UPI0025F25AA4|nr:hypothetical protein [Shimia sp.]MCH2066379.1 hypothetical protein [Shimia sp.]